jgi:DNA-binding Lrp family transcriptional regulator
LHSKFDLLLKVRAKNLNQLRDIVENKICKIPHISKTELMIVLKTKKEEQMISLEKDIEYKEMLYLNDDDRLRSFSNLSLIGE